MINRTKLQHLLAAEGISKQAGPKVSRTRDGFEVVGGDWPQFIIDQHVDGINYPADRPPGKVEGTAHYSVKLRYPDALVLQLGDLTMSWKSRPAVLVGTVEWATFDPMGRSLEDFTDLFSRRAEISLKGGLYHVHYVVSVGRKPVEGLVSLTFGKSSLFKKIPLAALKRDGVLEDAPVQIGGAKVGTVLIPKGLAPDLNDLRGLFD